MNLERIVSSYARSAQPNLQKEITQTSPEGLNEMQKETRETQFEIQKVIYEGGRAYMRVQRKRGPETEIEIVNLIKEGPDWKLLP